MSVFGFCKKKLSVKIIKNKKIMVYAKGYNLGLSEINSEYYVLLNNDVEVTKNWLDPMINLLESDENYATLLKIRSLYKRERFDYASFWWFFRFIILSFLQRKNF